MTRPDTVAVPWEGALAIAALVAVPPDRLSDTALALLFVATVNDTAPATGACAAMASV